MRVVGGVHYRDRHCMYMFYSITFFCAHYIAPTTSRPLRPLVVNPAAEPQVLGPGQWHVAVATLSLVVLKLGELRLPASLHGILEIWR